MNQEDEKNIDLLARLKAVDMGTDEGQEIVRGIIINATTLRVAKGVAAYLLGYARSLAKELDDADTGEAWKVEPKPERIDYSNRLATCRPLKIPGLSLRAPRRRKRS